MRPNGSQSFLQQRRFQALSLFENGLIPVEISHRLGVDRRSVRRWKANYQSRGSKGLEAKAILGRPTKLKLQDRDKLQKHLMRGAEACGFSTNLWTCPRIASVIRRYFHIDYHVDHVGRLLRSLGWSPQKPEHRALERDEKAIRTWVRYHWPRIKKKPKKLKAHLVFIDESGLLMAPLLHRTWAPRGQTPILLQRGRTFQKISMIAALTVAPQRQRVSLYFSLHANANITAHRAGLFLSLLRRHLRKTMVVVWDRAQIHRARSVTTQHPFCHLTHFPAYAPELNPVEILWSYLKKNPLANFAPKILPALAAKARYHSTKLRHQPSLLRSFRRATPLF